jgi:hypothetical protein
MFSKLIALFCLFSHFVFECKNICWKGVKTNKKKKSHKKQKKNDKKENEL